MGKKNKDSNYQEVECKECGYKTQAFHGWSFCMICSTPGKPGICHNFIMVTTHE